MPKLTLTAKEVIYYLRKIDRLNMIVPKFWNELTPTEIANCFNGVGSDLTWKPFRKALSWIFRWAICSVIIHDVIWSYIEKYELTEEDFYKSNEALKINARKELADNTSRWNPLYWIRYNNARLAQKACNNLGKKAWNTK